MRKATYWIVLFICTSSFSQVTIDESAYGYFNYALQFSSNDLFGSSRMLGIGGAQNALGADIGTQALNPAGLGVYRKSDWGLSLGTDQLSAQSQLQTTVENTTTRSSDGNINVPVIGFVFASKEDDPDVNSWKNQAFGMSVTRLNSFDQSFNYKGRNRNFSFRNFLVEAANGTNYQEFANQFDQGLVQNVFGGAYYGYILNAIDESGNETQQSTYFTIDGDKDDVVEEQVNQSGRTNQWNFGYGANYEDKLYIGGNLGVLSLRREINSTYTESLVVENDLTSFSYITDEVTRGIGLNFSVGIITRPTNNVRLGFTYKSPTAVSLTEEFEARTVSNFNNFLIPGTNVVLNELQFRTPRSSFSYQLKMPAKYTLGGAYFIQKKAFISADVDFIPYHRMSLTSDFDPFTGDNATINAIYKTGINFRIGGEYRYDIYRARIGFARIGNPYRKEFETTNIAQNNITAGAGIRLKDYYFDLAAVYSTQNRAYRSYSFNDGGEPFVDTRFSSTRLVFTGGIFF